MTATLAALEAAFAAPRVAPLTADQIIEALQRQPGLNIDFGAGNGNRGLYVEDEPRPGQDFCSFRASRMRNARTGDAETQRFDRLEDALQWLLAR